MSYFDSLFRRAAPSLLVAPRAEDPNKKVILRGLRVGGGDLVVDLAIAGTPDEDRDTVREGRRERKVHVEELMVRVVVDREIPLSTSVVVPRFGEQEWTIDRMRVGKAFTTLWLYRSEDAQIQRANIERGVR